MPVSKYYQEKLGTKGATDQVYHPTTGMPLGGATKVPTATPAPINDQGIKSFGNLSGLLGGGQYNIAEDKGQVIKSPRLNQATFAGRQALRGPYFTENVGIDHIVPISLGGTDNPSNIQLLPKKTFNAKTVVDDLAAFLYQKGKIPLGVARNVNKNWNNNPAALLDVQKLQNDPELQGDIKFSDGTTFSIKDALKKIQAPEYAQSVLAPDVPLNPGIGTVVKGLGAAAEKTLEKGLNIAEGTIGAVPYGILEAATGQKPFGQATKEYFSNSVAGKEGVFSQPIFKSGLRGFTKGITAGYIDNNEPIQYSYPEEATVGRVVGTLAQAYGTVQNLKALGGLFADAGIASTGVKALDRGLAAIKIPQMVEAVSNTSLAKALSASPLIKDAILSSGLFAAQGQISKQEAGGLEERAKRLLSDLANGAFYSITGNLINTKLPPVKAGAFSPVNITAGTLANAYTGYVVSKMEGASDEDALMNGAVFGVLHASGLYENRGKTMADIQQTAAEQGPLAGMRDFYENRTTLRGQQIAQKQAIDYFRKLGVEGNIRTDTEINKAVTKVKETLAQEVADGNMTHEQAAPLFQQAVLSSRFLHTQNLPFKEQVKQQVRDIASAFSTPKPTTIDTTAIKGSIIDDSGGKEFIKQTDATSVDSQVEAQIPSIWDKQIMLTGTRAGVPGEERNLANQNLKSIIDLLKTDPQTDVKVVFERQPNHPQDPKAIRATAYVDGGDGVHVGYVPSARMVDIQNQGRGAVNQETGAEYKFDPDWNNSKIADLMDGLGVNKVEASLSPTWLTNIGTNRGVVSGEPYMVLQVGKDNMTKAVMNQTQQQNPGVTVNNPIIMAQGLARQVPEAVPTPENRKEFFLAMPPSPSKVMANGVFSKIEDNVKFNDSNGLVSYLNSLGTVIPNDIQDKFESNLKQLTYGGVMNLLRSAERMNELNAHGRLTMQTLENNAREFVATHGREGWLKFLNTPISGQGAVTADTQFDLAAPRVPIVQTEEPNFKTPPVTEAKTIIEIPITTEGRKKNIFINQAVVEGTRKIVPNDYNNFSDNGKLSGISKRVVNKIVDLINNDVPRNDPRIEKLFKFYNGLSREKMQLSAKETNSFDGFLKRYIKKAEDIGIDPFDNIQGRPTSGANFYDQYDNTQLQEFKRRYNILKQTAPKGTSLNVNIAGDGLEGIKLKESSIVPKEPDSMMAEQIVKEGKNFRNEDGTPGIRQLRLNTDNLPKLPGSHPAQVETLARQMKAQDTFFLTNQNGVPTTSQGIYVSPETQKEFIDRYDKNPEKYAVSDPEVLKQWKQYLPEENPNSKEFKVMQVFFKDVLGAGTNFDAAALFKRVNLFDDKSIKWNEPGNIRVLFFPDTDLKQIESPGFTPPNFDRNDPRAQGFLNKTLEDGGRFQMPELNKQIQFYMGNTTGSFNTKGTISMMLPDNQGLFVEKGNTGTLDGATRLMLEKKYGIDLQPTDIVSFQTNVKMGKKALKSLDANPDVKYYEVPKDSMRFLYEETPHDPEATFSLSGILGKFSKNDMVNIDGQNVPISPYLTAMFSPQAKKWVETWNSVMQEGANPVDVLEKNYAKDLEAEGYGKLKNMAANKADVVSLNRQFQTHMLKLFQETVMRNRDLEGAHLKLTPDLGFYDINENKTRYLRARQGPGTMGEAMVSRAMADQLGNPEFLMVARYPVTKKLALTKVKVLVGEDYGRDSLGQNNIVLNTHDVYINKEGDADGDSVHIYKIIPKAEADQAMAKGEALKGVPEPIVDHIEQERENYIKANGAEYGTQGIEGNPYPKIPAASFEGRLYIAKRATEAKQAIGGISNASNMMNLFVDNANDAKIRSLFTVNGQFYQPKATFDQQDKVGQILQAAVDGTKSQAFSQLPAVDKNAFSVIFDTKDAKVLSVLWKNISETYAQGFKLGNTKYATGNTMLKNMKDFLAITPTDPNSIHPFQEILQPFSGAVDNKIEKKEIWDSDVAATEAVKKQFPQPEITDNAKDFIKFLETDWLPKKLKAAREKAPESIEIRSGQPVLDYYYNHLNKFTKADLEAISYYLTTSKESNQWYDPNFYANNAKNGWYVERFDQLMLPEHAQAYYKARQAWYDQNILKKAPEAQISPPESPVAPPPTNTSSQPIQPELPQFNNLQSKLQDISMWQKATDFKKYKNLGTLDLGKTYLVEQNQTKPSQWANLAKLGHQVAWEFNKGGGGYTGRVLIDGKFYTKDEARTKFLGSKPA